MKSVAVNEVPLYDPGGSKLWRSFKSTRANAFGKKAWRSACYVQLNASYCTPRPSAAVIAGVLAACCLFPKYLEVPCRVSSNSYCTIYTVRDCKGGGMWPRWVTAGWMDGGGMYKILFIAFIYLFQQTSFKGRRQTNHIVKYTPQESSYDWYITSHIAKLKNYMLLHCVLVALLPL